MLCIVVETAYNMNSVKHEQGWKTPDWFSICRDIRNVSNDLFVLQKYVHEIGLWRLDWACDNELEP